MPTTPITVLNGNIMEVRVRQRMDNQVMLNVLHYRCDITGTPPTFSSVVTALDTALKQTNGFLTRLNALQVDVAQHIATDYQIVAPLRFVAATMPGLGGGQVVTDGESPPSPPNVAAVITRVPQRAAKGRVSNLHIGGLLALSVRTGQIQVPLSTRLADLGAASIFVQALLGGVTLQPILFKRSVPADSLDLSDYRTQFTSRTMSRRTVGRGI